MDACFCRFLCCGHVGHLHHESLEDREQKLPLRRCKSTQAMILQLGISFNSDNSSCEAVLSAFWIVSMTPWPLPLDMICLSLSPKQPKICQTTRFISWVEELPQVGTLASSDLTGMWEDHWKLSLIAQLSKESAPSRRP